MKEFTYVQANLKAEHFRALGIHEVWLKEDLWDGRENNYPWHLVVDVEPRGIIDTVVNFKFTARDEPALVNQRPIAFVWFYDMEKPRSNVNPESLNVDMTSCRAVMKCLSPVGREKFRKLLLSSVENIRTQANELSKTAEKMLAEAATLSDIACMS